MTTSDAKTILVDIISHLLASDPDSVLGQVLEDLDLSSVLDDLGLESVQTAFVLGRPHRLSAQDELLHLSVLISDDRFYLLINAVDQAVWRALGQDERPVALIAALVKDGFVGVVGSPKTQYLVLEVVPKDGGGAVIYPGCFYEVPSDLGERNGYARLRLTAARFALLLELLNTLLENGTFMVGDLPIPRSSKTPPVPELIL
ncbi:hypothetical protein A2368_00285 [Candidatus Collierbacteria bacterium RIFOXYB1_FULL_49_13]|uniref:Uncharacterized protein n=1 Tax=Candidatus Collierbacteria bacterium RIFOXYB1_FULL_49_13 TaxID=1817728 RepID=A0A1F5FER6_9BACT|nr:MAG: hypothetical protein A2368_00285 [Candidatus Collierbacteria bacterium RIFOXYB1_FULL_49_13]